MKEIRYTNKDDTFLKEKFDAFEYLAEADYYSKIFFEVDSDFLMDNWDILDKLGEINENPQDPLQYVLTTKSKKDERKALKILPKIAVEDIHRL